MKKERYIIIALLLVIIIHLLFGNNLILRTGTQIVKEMTEGEYESKLTELNKSHEDYATSVQSYKASIASAITDMGVETSADATADIMANNIRSIQMGNSTEQKLLLDQKVVNSLSPSYTYTVTEEANYFIIVAVYAGTPIVTIDGIKQTYTHLYSESSPIYEHYYYLLGKLSKGTNIVLSTTSKATGRYYLFKS